MTPDGSMGAAIGVSATGTALPRRGPLLVLMAGIITTVLALLDVWWLDTNTQDVNIMGWYGDYVIPAGAMLVGFVAGSGYGIASYLTGFRIRRGLLLAVLALQLGAYAGAQVLEFKSLMRETPLVDENGETLTFVRFYQLRALNFSWKENGHQGKPIGEWGYLFLGLGVVGFVLGGMLAPAILLKAPYCERCQLYMRSRTLALVPASAKARRVSKKDAAQQAAYKDEQDRAAATAGTLLTDVAALAAHGDAMGVKSVVSRFPPRGADARRIGKLPARLRIGLVSCRQCAAGYLQPAMMTGQGRAIKVRKLDRLAMPDGTARMIA